MSGNEQNQEILQQKLKGKKLSSKTLKRDDSLNLESRKVTEVKKVITLAK